MSGSRGNEFTASVKASRSVSFKVCIVPFSILFSPRLFGLCLQGLRYFYFVVACYLST